MTQIDGWNLHLKKLEKEQIKHNGSRHSEIKIREINKTAKKKQKTYVI